MKKSQAVFNCLAQAVDKELFALLLQEFYARRTVCTTALKFLSCLATSSFLTASFNICDLKF